MAAHEVIGSALSVLAPRAGSTSSRSALPRTPAHAVTEVEQPVEYLHRLRTGGDVTGEHDASALATSGSANTASRAGKTP